MYKYLLILCTTMLFTLKNYGQDSSIISKTDSLALTELMNMLDSGNTSFSYASINTGVGNRLFSVKNNALNSKQASVNTIVYSAGAGYFHKSGFSISAGLNMLNDISKGFELNQYSVTPAFDLLNNKSIGFGVSYSHYFIADKYSQYSSPVQNDWYAYLYYKNKILQPGISAGYSSGTFRDITKFTLPLTGREFTDTGTYNIRSFSLTGSLSQVFDWYDVFSKEDGLSFTPTLQINFSSDSTETVSHTIGQNLLRNVKRLKRIRRPGTKNDFAVQSAGLSLDVNYSVGKFSFEPQVYLDYYFPKTDEKKFSQYYSLTVTYTLY
ncbi:MAG: hypothetical protein QM791_11820 [Ferruginibacter sp.]